MTEWLSLSLSLIPRFLRWIINCTGSYTWVSYENQSQIINHSFIHSTCVSWKPTMCHVLCSALNGQPQTHWWTIPYPQCSLLLGFLPSLEGKNQREPGRGRDVSWLFKSLWSLIFFLTKSRDCYICKHQMHSGPKHVCALYTYVYYFAHRNCFKLPTGTTHPAGRCSGSAVNEIKCTWPGGLWEAPNLWEEPTRASGPAQRMTLCPLQFIEDRRTNGSEKNSSPIYISLSFPTTNGSLKSNLNFCPSESHDSSQEKVVRSSYKYLLSSFYVPDTVLGKYGWTCYYFPVLTVITLKYVW